MWTDQKVKFIVGVLALENFSWNFFNRALAKDWNSSGSFESPAGTTDSAQNGELSSQRKRNHSEVRSFFFQNEYI